MWLSCHISIKTKSNIITSFTVTWYSKSGFSGNKKNVEIKNVMLFFVCYMHIKDSFGKRWNVKVSFEIK